MKEFITLPISFIDSPNTDLFIMPLDGAPEVPEPKKEIEPIVPESKLMNSLNTPVGFKVEYVYDMFDDFDEDVEEICFAVDDISNMRDCGDMTIIYLKSDPMVQYHCSLSLEQVMDLIYNRDDFKETKENGNPS